MGATPRPFGVHRFGTGCSHPSDAGLQGAEGGDLLTPRVMKVRAEAGMTRALPETLDPSHVGL